MIGDAVDHSGFARPADAVGTGEGDVYSVVEQDIQDGFPRRHGDGAPAAMQAHFEAAVRIRSFCHRVVSLAAWALQGVAEIGAKFRFHVRTAEIDP